METLLAFFLANAVFALPAVNPWIMGGVTEPFGSPAEQSVLSLTEANGVEFCTAVLIARDKVLSSAHCAREKKSIFLKHHGHIFAIVDQIEVHPRYYGEADQWSALPSWDLAILTFHQSLPSSMGVAILADQQFSLQLGQFVSLSGYGLGSDSTERPDTTQLQVVGINSETHGIILHATMEHGICYGDSGGPAYLVVKQQILVYGIASHFVGTPKIDCSDDILYTDVRFFSDWIARHTGND